MTPVEFLKGQKTLAGRHLSLAVGLGVLAGFLLILQAWCLARIVDGVIFQQQTLVEVMPWAWGMLALLLVRAGLAYASEQVAFQAAAVVKQALRERLFERLQALGPLYLAGQRSGAIAMVLTDGVEALEAYYARYLPAMSLAGLIPLAILAFVLPMDWQSALVMLVTAPLIPFFMILIGKGAERLNQSQWRQMARMSGHFLDVIQGLTTLKLFNASRREAKVIARIADDYRNATMKVLRVAFLSSLALEFFATVSIAIVAVLIGFRLLFGELDFFTGFFVLLLAPEYYLPLRSLGTHYHARMEAIGAAEQMLEVLDTPLPPQSDGGRPLPDVPLAIRIEALHFAYEPGRDALNGVDLAIGAGERVALVGPSGSGKTTLVNLLLGFAGPQQGRIVINGEALGDLDLAGWRARLAWVPQRPRLFHGTVADNIRLGRPGATVQQLAEAARLAQADEFIDGLPDGMDTVIGDGGRGLSGGQAQRLALARAFLRDAELVIMDEPTAHLDAHSEALIQRALETLADGRTLLTIAHRLETVRQSDRIVVLDAGRVAEQGDHAALMAQGGLYRCLVGAGEALR